ncbi:MAG: tRNA (adenosine(37)-N6)-threonylcarbamoyltransferase complex dimerization subunit type 1 TsaB [Gammaproteobacteria bacterium]|nr:tRNA (adenosine(37)-N6)-threonylcarbamoyltransferase complex dimerization subunit type 1 TsaB [Gammaproteobacteria bacterium]
MKVLALDSATEACSAALLHEGGLIERYELLGRGHAERLLPMVDELLTEAGIGLPALDAIAFGRGPGSFTGLRVAAGITQGLAAGAQLPVLPVSDLAAVASAAARLSVKDWILVCMDARMGQVYWAAFDCSASPPLALTEETVANPAEVVPPGEGPWFGAGHGFKAYPALAASLGVRLVGIAPELLPRASDIARLAAVDFAAGRGLPAEQALPVYLRNEVVHRR